VTGSRSEPAPGPSGQLAEHRGSGAGLRIAPLDPGDDAAMRAWHATYLAAQEHARPHAVPLRLEEMRAKFLAERATERDLAFTGTVDHTAVVVGQVHLPLRDNLDQSFVEVNTLPRARRRGHGTRMLDHLERVASGHGRSVLLCEVDYPYDASVDGVGTPGADFARARGYDFNLATVQRVLALPVDEARLRALVAQAAPHHRDYTFRQFTGAIPEDVVDSFAAIVGTLMTEAPSGDITHEPEVFDVTRIRADEEVFAASGRTKFTTLALDRAGAVAAYTELVLPAFDPGKVFQWGTLARPQDRGHRLGLATKARNLLWAQPRLGPASLVTFNAEVNVHMVGVNEQLGFVPVARIGEYHKRV
jgi:GNAT superfamily N-acetyltransferase